MRRVAVALAATVAAGAAGCGSGAAGPPFGHACVPQSGVRFCPTKTDAQRVPSFDGVPLDVDVTLPLTGGGPFPTIVMLHGFGGQDKTFWEASTPEGERSTRYHFNNVFFAQHGYAVVTYSARGFGRSCGKVAASTPGCARGWFHFADQRFEARDAQTLVGKLVDEGVTDPDAVGVTGESYGGGTALELAHLRDRVRMPDGSLVPWKSPGGRPLRIAAAWPRWGWSDLTYALVPNGRFLSDGVWQPATPLGVVKRSLFDDFYRGGTSVAQSAPPGADPTADLAGWRRRLFRGEPYGAAVRADLEQLRRYKSAAGLPPSAAPLLIQNGWTDPELPAEEALRAYNRVRVAAGRKAPVSLQLGDIGHYTGGESQTDYARFNDDGAAFFAHYLRGLPGGPAPGSVSVFGQGCPKGSPGFGPIDAPSYVSIARGSFRLVGHGSGDVTSRGGDRRIARAVDPVSHPDRCARLRPGSERGAVVLRRRSRGFTELGMPLVRAKVRASGSAGQIDARLWDVSHGRQRLVDLGVYRVERRQRGKVEFQLFGNGYRFAKGHTVQLELVGRSPPLFRASNGEFRLRLSNVRASIPTREAPRRARAVAKPESPR
jgi:predicted acyl esterase